MASHRHQHAPDWSALPTELLLEVAKLLLPSQLGSFALVSRAWRQAVLPLVTVLHVPLLSSITLPSGPAGSQQIEVVEQYLDFLKQQQRQPQHQRQQVQQNSRAGESANQTTQENAPIHGKGYGHGCGSNGTHNSNHASAHSDGIGDVDAKNRQRGATAGSADCGGLSATTRPSLAASQPSTNADIGLSLHPGISPPLMQHLLSRFPFVRTVGMHRSQLQHPRLEVAALQGLSTCQPTVSQLHMYDTLAWDFPQQLTNLGALTQLVTLKLWSLGAPGLDPSAQWAFSRGLMALSGLTLLQELTLRWLFGRQEVVWTCPHTPRLLRALTDGGARLRGLDLNAFLLDRAAAASLARITSLRSLSLYFDSEGAGWEEVVSLMSLPELTRLILSYEGNAVTGPWIGDGPPAGDDDQPPPGGPAAGHHQQHKHPPLPGGADAHPAGLHVAPAHALPNLHQHDHHRNAPVHGHPQPSHRHAETGTGQGINGGSLACGSMAGRPRLPSWAARQFSLQYLSLTTSPALHRLLGRLDVLVPNLTYLSLSSVGEFGPGQRELEAGLMAMAQAGSRLSRIKLFCMELRPELMSCLTALPALQELMLFNVWVAVDGTAGGQAAAAAEDAVGLAAVAAMAVVAAAAAGQAFVNGAIGGDVMEAEGPGAQLLPPEQQQGQGHQHQGPDQEPLHAAEHAEPAAAGAAAGAGPGDDGAQVPEHPPPPADVAVGEEVAAPIVPDGPQHSEVTGNARMQKGDVVTQVQAQPGPLSAGPSSQGAAAIDDGAAAVGTQGQEQGQGEGGGVGGGSSTGGEGAAEVEGSTDQQPPPQAQAAGAAPEAAAGPDPAAAAALQQWPELQLIEQQQHVLEQQQQVLQQQMENLLQLLNQGPQMGAGIGAGGNQHQQEGGGGGAGEQQQPAAQDGGGGAGAQVGQEVPEGEPPLAGQGAGPGVAGPGPVGDGGPAVAGEDEDGAAGAAAGDGPLPEGVLLRNALRATAMAQSHLEALASLGGRLQQLLIEFGPEGSTCFITQGLVRTLEPLAPALRSLHLLSWNMEGLMLPALEPLCFTAFTCLKSLTVANRISPDSQVNFATPLPETSGHVIYMGELPRTLRSLCANRVNLYAGTPFEFPTAGPEPSKASVPSASAATTATTATGAGSRGTGVPSHVASGSSHMRSVATQTEGVDIPPGAPLTYPAGSAIADTQVDVAQQTGTERSSDSPGALLPEISDDEAGPSNGGKSRRREDLGAAGAGVSSGSSGSPIAPPLLHMWLADCNVRGARPEELAAAMPGLQTLVVRHVSKQEDLPVRLINVLHQLKDLTTLGLGGFDHRFIRNMWGLTQLRHLMLDPRRFEDVELEPELMLDAMAAESDRSLALHEATMALVAKGGMTRLRSLWLPDWAAPPHQMVQWQMQIAQVAPLAALRLVDHHYFWRLPAPVGCPEVQDRLQWWGFDAWNVL